MFESLQSAFASNQLLSGGAVLGQGRLDARFDTSDDTARLESFLTDIHAREHPAAGHRRESAAHRDRGRASPDG